ncbi:MAG: flavin monoamine oxidase family protein [Betaproteobacteria bacterium]
MDSDHKGNSNPVVEVDVAIIGAGLSGLVSGKELRQAGRESFLILEARDRVGGRTVNLEILEGVISEGGGQWIGPTQTEIHELAAELGVETFKSYCSGKTVYFVGDETFTESGEDGSIVSASPLVEEINAMAAQVQSAAPWAAPRAEEWDKMSLADWLATKSPSDDDMVNFFLSATLTYGAPPEELGLLHYLTLINSFACDLTRLESMKNGAQEERLVGGSWALSAKMAEQLRDKIRLGSPVRRISGWDKGRVELQTDKGTLRAREVIFSMSQLMAQNIEFEPSLPLDRVEMHASWPRSARMRKVAHVYERPFWREAGFNGQVLDIGGALLWSADNSPPDASVGILVCFVREGALTSDPDEAGRELASVYARAFGDQALSFIQYHDVDWGQDEWTLSCVSPYPPGFLTRWGLASRKPLGRIHWSGTDMAELHPSSMDGAIRAGRAAANQVLNSLSRR